MVRVLSATKNGKSDLSLKYICKSKENIVWEQIKIEFMQFLNITNLKTRHKYNHSFILLEKINHSMDQFPYAFSFSSDDI